MMSTSCTRICTYTFVNAYEMYKLSDVVKVPTVVLSKKKKGKSQD